MEDIITYIIVFGVIIGGVAVWQFRRGKERPYIISSQYFTDLTVSILIRKQEGKTKSFVIKIHSKKHQILQNMAVELISKSRSFMYFGSDFLCHHLDLPIEIKQNQKVDFVYGFETLKKMIQEQAFDYKSFRIVIEMEEGKKFKSHEMAFNKHWVIYRPDSGNYN